MGRKELGGGGGEATGVKTFSKDGCNEGVDGGIVCVGRELVEMLGIRDDDGSVLGHTLGKDLGEGTVLGCEGTNKSENNILGTVLGV